MELLTSNTKLGKLVPGWSILGLQLLPGDSAGKGELCPERGACYASCLAWAGMGAFPAVREARKRRTELLFEQPQAFAAMLDAELLRATCSAISRAERLAVRLNVLSDIDWRDHPAVYRVLRRHAKGGVAFYDYTKRMERPDPALYGSPARVCYSWSERSTVPPAWADWVAAVCADGAENSLPGRLIGWQSAHGVMSDGDRDDLFFLRPRGIQVLRPKGPARKAREGGLVQYGARFDVDRPAFKGGL